MLSRAQREDCSPPHVSMISIVRLRNPPPMLLMLPCSPARASHSTFPLVIRLSKPRLPAADYIGLVAQPNHPETVRHSSIPSRSRLAHSRVQMGVAVAREAVPPWTVAAAAVAAEVAMAISPAPATLCPRPSSPRPLLSFLFSSLPFRSICTTLCFPFSS